MELIKCVDVEWWNGMEGGDVDVVDARSRVLARSPHPQGLSHESLLLGILWLRGSDVER